MKLNIEFCLVIAHCETVTGNNLQYLVKDLCTYWNGTVSK